MERLVSINISGHLPSVVEVLGHSVALHELLADVEMAIDQHVCAAGDMRCSIILPHGGDTLVSIDIEVKQGRCH